MSRSTLLLLFLAPTALAEEEQEAEATEEEEEIATEEEGLAAFEDIYEVSQHPRCMNCHPDGDAPLQTDEGVPHDMNIDRFSPNVGLPCSTCHRVIGLRGIRNLPPADSHWRMPPAEQGFQGRTLQQLCEQLNDTSRTGGRDLHALAEHVETDHLLMTSWHSGRTHPHISHEALTERFRTWAAAGGPCPDPPTEEQQHEE